jgi:outer membrane protein assembly factor BamA
MHYSKSRGVFFLALWMFWVSGGIGVFAQSGIVEDIVFTGLKRTKPFIAERLLEKFRGLKPEEINENDVRAAIIESGILDPERIEFLPHDGDDNYTLHAVVVEKMSFFPIPLFLAGSSGWMAGLALADLNAFGIRDTFALTGIYSDDSWFVMGMYSHAGVVAAKPGFTLAASYSRHEFKASNARGEQLVGMKRAEIGASAGLTYQFTRLWGGRFTLGYNRNDIETLNRTDHTITARPRIDIHSNNWDGYLLNRNSAAFEYEMKAVLDDTVYHRLGIVFNYDRSIFGGFRWTAKGGAVWSPEAGLFTETSPSAVSITVMPNDFRATAMAGLYAGVEKVLWRMNVGTLAILAAYEALASQSLSDGNTFDHGAFAGVQFYLRRIAIPAVGLGFSYNLVRETAQWNFSIGMRF